MNTTARQPDLLLSDDSPLFEIKEGHPAIEWLVGQLEGGEWLHAQALLEAAGRPVNEHGRRWVRRLADKSRGRVAGGQLGYKLIRKMTHEEYQHWRNWMASQADHMKRRVIEADRIWYARPSVTPGTGLLDGASPTPDAEYAI